MAAKRCGCLVAQADELASVRRKYSARQSSADAAASSPLARRSVTSLSCSSACDKWRRAASSGPRCSAFKPSAAETCCVRQKKNSEHQPITNKRRRAGEAQIQQDAGRAPKHDPAVRSARNPAAQGAQQQAADEKTSRAVHLLNDGEREAAGAEPLSKRGIGSLGAARRRAKQAHSQKQRCDRRR